MEKKVVKIIGSIDEVKMDREGEYTVKLKFPHNQKNNIKELEDFVNNPIICFFTVEDLKNFYIDE